MESPRREESEVRLFSPFLLSAGFPQASCVIPPKITLILRSLFPQRSLPSSGQPFLFLFLLRHAASLGSASPWSTACYLVVSLHPPLPLFTAPLLNTSWIVLIGANHRVPDWHIQKIRTTEAHHHFIFFPSHFTNNGNQARDSPAFPKYLSSW